MLYITLRQLEYITAIADAGGISAAAEALHVSQPSLSVALAQVEGHLGQRLFHRAKGRTISPTPFGRVFVAGATRLLQGAAALTDPKTAEAPAGQRLVLGCFSDLAPLCLGPAAEAIRAALSGVDVTYHIAGFADLAAALHSGEVDLAISYDIGLDRSFARRIWASQWPSAFMAAGHKLADSTQVVLADLTAEPLILFDEGLSARHVLGLFRAQGITPRVAHRVRSLELMRSMAARGDGVGISYTTPPNGQSYDGRVVISRPITDPTAAEPVLIVARESALKDATIAAAITALASAAFPGS